jgi:hypothetical protein
MHGFDQFDMGFDCAWWDYFYYEWDGDFKSNLKMKQFTKTKINHQDI